MHCLFVTCATIMMNEWIHVIDRPISLYIHCIFVTNRLFMKLFDKSDISFVKHCQDQFNIILPSVALERRRTKVMYTHFVAFNLRGCSMS